jgi:signal transduction histidine kinase
VELTPRQPAFDNAAVFRIPRRPALAWGVLTGGVASILLAWLEFAQRPADLFYASAERLEFGAYLLFSLALSVLAFAVERLKVLHAILAFRALFCLLLLRFVVSYEVISVAVLGAVVLEACLYEPDPIGLSLGLGLSCTAAALAWHVGLSFAGSMEMLLLGTGLSFAMGLLTHYRERLIAAQEEIDRLDGAVTQLSDANLGYQRYAQTAEERSTRSERQRVTREIHDIVGYTLTNSIMMMEAATDMVKKDPQRVGRLIDTARRNAERGLEDVRRALRALRAQYAEDDTGLRAIVKLVNVFEVATGVRVEAEFGNLPWTFGEEVDAAVYHVIQEGLVNAFRHGRASAVKVLFWVSDRVLRVHVWDNGRGSTQIVEGIGLSGMRERVAALGGTITAGGRPDGFQIMVDIPVEPLSQIAAQSLSACPPSGPVSRQSAREQAETADVRRRED